MTVPESILSRFQNRVWLWLNSTFGAQVAMSRQERGARLLEESLELAQVTGVTEEQAKRLVQYVFSREPGELKQEIGGVGVCLYALGAAHGELVDLCVAQELGRCEANAGKIREKHRRKPPEIKGA